MRLSGHTPLTKLNQVSVQQKTLLSSLWVESAEEFTAMMAAMEAAKTTEDAIYTSLKESENALLEGVPEKALAPWRATRTGGALGCEIDPDVLNTFRAEGRISSPGGAAAQISEAALPPSVRLTDRLFPVRNQGKRGTCVAFATVGLREFIDGCETELGEQFLYWACKQIDGWPDEPGTTIHSAMSALANFGSAPAETWSYVSEPEKNNESQGPPPAGAEEAALKFVMPYTRTVAPNFVNHYKQVLSGVDGRGGMPVVIASLVFKSWYMSAATHQTGKITMPLPGEQPLPGGHAMLVVGYQDDSSVPGGGYFIVRNSWGEEWAPSSPETPGHALIPYAYINNYIAEAFSGQELSDEKEDSTSEKQNETVMTAQSSSLDFEQQYVRTLRKEMRNVDGKLLQPGARVIANPEAPAEVMEDTPANRTQFRERGFAWTDEAISALWLPPKEKWNEQLKSEFSDLQNSCQAFCSAIDKNITSAKGSFAPDIDPPFWCYALAWMPRIKAVTRTTDLSSKLVADICRCSQLPEGVAPPEEWNEAMESVNKLTIYTLRGRTGQFHVVSAFVSPMSFSRNGAPAFANPGAEYLDMVRRLHDKWCAEDGVKAKYTFFTIGAPSDWGAAAGSSTGSHLTVLSSPDSAGAWSSSSPPQFATGLHMRNFLDRLYPETRQQRISRIKNAVDGYIDNHYEGNILLDKIAKKTQERRTNIKDAFSEMQASGHYECYRVNGSLAIRKSKRGGRGIRIRADDASFVRYHLGLLGGVFFSILGMHVFEFSRTGTINWFTFFFVLILLYLGKSIETAVRRRQQDL